MKTLSIQLFAVLAALFLPLAAAAQVNSGSNGSDGALHPTSNLVIDMADHLDGIYHYTSVHIPAGVTVSFIPNAGNKPVVWLVQGDCVIAGTLELSGQGTAQLGINYTMGGRAGPGGYRGGNGGQAASEGQGPGGGKIGTVVTGNAGNASFGRLGRGNQDIVGAVYGNQFVLPLIGGSGGGGSINYGSGGGGGGGALLIAASERIELLGEIFARGGNGGYVYPYSSPIGGGGSGGSVRLVSAKVLGSGSIHAAGGWNYSDYGGGEGRVRFDVLENNFGGNLIGVFTQGFQPIIVPAPGQGIQLGIQSLAGVAVAASPSGVLANPDVIIPAQQSNPISVVVRCTNLPLNTEISVVVHPANGPDVQAVGLNHAGTAAASTATVSLNMPRGGGIIYAKAVTGIAGGGAALGNPADAKTRSLAETGWTADGERFEKMEITAALGGPQRITYITESGKRHPAN